MESSGWVVAAAIGKQGVAWGGAQREESGAERVAGLLPTSPLPSPFSVHLSLFFTHSLLSHRMPI